MRPSLLTAAVLGVFVAPAVAQVSGVGYTVAPRVAYLFPSDNSGLANTFAIGGDFGFSFGQFIELRANYLQSVGGATELERLGEELLEGNLPDARDVGVRRIGGDVKFNLGKGAFLPYVTIGTGIQRLDLDGGNQNSNIYGNAGLGFVLSAADRYTFFVEGRYLQYRNNAFQALLTDAERLERNLELTGETRRVGNYSLEAGAAFYLGGRRPGEMTELDRAYARQFGNGFRGASLEIEPTLARVNFDGALPYRDAWFGGASLGFNFGPLVGLRGYYYRAMQDDEVNFDFDDLAMYGVDMRFNLNTVRTGLAPFLIIGGGYLDVRDEYIGTENLFEPRSQGFATGGGGIVLGLSRNLKLRGSVKALLTSASEVDVDELVTTDQITTSTQYTIGLDLALGRKADASNLAEQQRQEAMDAQRQRDLVQRDSLLELQRERNEMARDSIRQEYESELAEREAALNAALAARDTATVDSLQALVEDTEDLLEEIEATDSTAAARFAQQQERLERERREAEFQRGLRSGASGNRDDVMYDDMAYDNGLRGEGYRRVRTDTFYMPDGSIRVERRVEVGEERMGARRGGDRRGASGGSIRMSVAEFEGLIEEIFESSMPLGPDVFAGSDGSFRIDGQDPLLVERRARLSADSAAAKTRRDNETLRRELDQLRRDVDAMRTQNAQPTPRQPTPRTQPVPPPPPAPDTRPTTDPQGSPNNDGAPDPGADGAMDASDGAQAPQTSDPDAGAQTGATEEAGGSPRREADSAERPQTVVTPLPAEETRRERRAREKAERKAAKAREKAEDPD